MNGAAWKIHRKISQRIVIEGNLVLESPTLLGGGDRTEQADIPLILDPSDGSALLSGASLAGALRNYLRERQFGYWQESKPGSLDKLLFGRQEGEEGDQSYIIISDARLENPLIELRDGVALAAETRTALDNRKYDFEVLAAGSTFLLRLEVLLVDDAKLKAELLQAASIALQGLELGEIAIGAKKRRGMGKGRVQTWKVIHYNLLKPQGLLGWLENDRLGIKEGSKIVPLLGLEKVSFDERCDFEIEAEFRLASPVLIRSGFGVRDAPDAVHLHALQVGGSPVPVLSGTSLAGAIRARALRIANTIREDGEEFVEELFGQLHEDETQGALPDDRALHASRFWISEARIQVESEVEWVQNRVKIDRFTGGAFETALFDEQPFFPKGGELIRLKMTLKGPSQAQIGLLLLAFKDLWNSDLPVGGEIGVGRGRLQGLNASLMYRSGQGSQETWQLEAGAEPGELILPADVSALENFVNAFIGGGDA